MNLSSPKPSQPKTNHLPYLLPLLTTTTLLFSLPAHAISFQLGDTDDAVLLWNNALLDAISHTNYGPTPVSRAIGIVNTSMFDAWAAYDPTAIGTQFGSRLQVPDDWITPDNKQQSISYAAYTSLVDLFPSQTDRFNQLMNDLGYDPENRTATPTTAAGIGNLVAQTLLDARHQDGSNQLNGYADTSGYQPVNTWDNMIYPDHWQPVSINDGLTVQRFLTPHWGDITPFAIPTDDSLLPPPPEPLLTADGTLNPAFLDQALELIEISANLTDEQKSIAEYWADGPATVLPPGHWQLFGQQVSLRDDLSLDENAQLFFALGNAVMDAGIAAWDAKATYDYVRPISAIRTLAANGQLPLDSPYVRLNDQTNQIEILAWAGPDQGTQWINGTDWLPYQNISFVTPPFAEYVSGHSTFSTAAADILTRFTGSDLFGGCHTVPANSSAFESQTPATDVQLCWDTFSAAADEAGLSRLYGGIHFEDGNLNGRTLGHQVSDAVWQQSQYYIQGGKSVPEPSTLLALLGVTLGGLSTRRFKRSRPSNRNASS